LAVSELKRTAHVKLKIVRAVRQGEIPPIEPEIEQKVWNGAAEAVAAKAKLAGQSLVDARSRLQAVQAALEKSSEPSREPPPSRPDIDGLPAEEGALTDFMWQLDFVRHGGVHEIETPAGMTAEKAVSNAVRNLCRIYDRQKPR
jgi:hypothetical protein